MCLGIPGRIEEIKDNLAVVSFGTVRRQVDIRLVENVCPGDYVLVHTGFAINKINQQEAEETLELIRQIGASKENGNKEKPNHESTKIKSHEVKHVVL